MISLRGDDHEALLAHDAVRHAAESDHRSRSARSFMSMVRGQVMRRGSMPSALPW